MDGAREFLEQVRQNQLVKGNFRGLLHLLIGRKITRTDGTAVSAGLTWRQLSELLKQMRWDKDCVKELGLDPDELPPRDRGRYWYMAILAAEVESPEATAAADKLVSKVKSLGYVISAPTGK